MSEKVKWLKIDENFVNDHGNLVNRPDGLSYLGIYLNLLGLALKNDGSVFLALRANMVDSISSLVNCSNKSIVRKCMSILHRYGYVETKENKELFFHEVKEIMEQECDSAARVRRYRINKNKKSKTLHCNKSDRPRPLHCNADVTIDAPLNKNINKPQVSTTYRRSNSDSCPNNVALGPSRSSKSSRSTKNKEIVFNNKEPSTYTAEQMFQEIEGESTPRKEQL